MRPELLAPAGNPVSLRAAVQNGADAVYLGCGDFNARRNAKNFSEEELPEAVRYCHARGVKVYLTLNTLLFDREFPAAARFIGYAASCGIDAVLVQDLGVLHMVRTVVPELPCHASTQMSIHNVDGALAARALGLSRVVLAREMTKEDIAAVCAVEGLETEIFVHGAHCMCYSGQCSMSALIGGRSGNRGTCAQPCRLPYRMDGRQGYPLSLKDMSLADHIPELCEMGIHCLKLEGRMKRPEYVAVVTKIYADLLREGRTPTDAERKALADAFSRDGFTDGYFEGETGRRMFGVRPENAREPKELFAAARKTYETETAAETPVDMELTILAGQPAALAASDPAGNRVFAEGPVPEAARNRALEAEELKARLAKTGGTGFAAHHITVHLDEGLSLPVSAINALRRSALSQLDALRCAEPVREIFPYTPLKKARRSDRTPDFTVSVAEPAQLTPALLAEAPARIDVPLEKIDGLDAALCKDAPLCVVLPRIYKDSDRPALLSLLEKAKAMGITEAMLSNLGHFELLRDRGFTLRGDYGLNVSNSESLRFLKQAGLASATVTFELRQEQIRDLAKALPAEAIVYGRLPLMITENDLTHGAPEKTAHLIDRTGADFPVLTVYGGRSELQNSKTLFLADKNDYQKLGLSFARLRFTTETPAECAAIFASYRHFGGTLPKDYTRGLFYRSVE